MESDKFLTFSRLDSGLALVIVIIMGWLFNLMASNSRDVGDRQSKASVRSAVNETRIEDVERRVDNLENSK